MADESTTASAGDGQAPTSWVLKTVTRVHVFLHRLTGGRYFNTLSGDEVCFVTFRRGKSGKMLTIPLMYVPYGEGVLLVASQGGAPKNPGWYSSLVKNPDIAVDHRGRKMQLRARVAAPEEKAALWPICDEHYAPYADYRKRTPRDIPIFVCEPRSD